MDFAVAQSIREALYAQIELSDLGYPHPEPVELRAEVVGWMARDYGWTIVPDDVIVIPDVVRGVELALLAHSSPGDAVVVQTPSYPPLLDAVCDHNRVLVEVPLVRGEGSWRLNFEELEVAFAAGARIMIFSSPNNPTGKMLSREEIKELVELAGKYSVLLVSDEVHSPLVYDGVQHIPTASLNSLACDLTITVTSPSKAWNLPGLRCAQMIVPKAVLRTPILELPVKMRKGSSILGVSAGVAALRSGHEWLEALRAQLATNRGHVSAVMEEYPNIGYLEPEAGYLAWLDVSTLQVEARTYADHFLCSKIALTPGEHFGGAGVGHVRLNFGTSTEILTQILERLVVGLELGSRPRI